MTTTEKPPDFVMLHPDGRIEWGHRTPAAAQLLNDSIRPHIPDLATQGMGRGSGLRMWFTDIFTPDMEPNRLADRVISALGYTHREGWRGVVAVSAEEDWQGVVPILPPEVREIITEMVRKAMNEAQALEEGWNQHSVTGSAALSDESET